MDLVAPVVTHLALLPSIETHPSWEYTKWGNLHTVDWEYPNLVSMIVMRDPIERFLAGGKCGKYHGSLGGDPTPSNQDIYWEYASEFSYLSQTRPFVFFSIADFLTSHSHFKTIRAWTTTPSGCSRTILTAPTAPTRARRVWRARRTC